MGNKEPWVPSVPSVTGRASVGAAFLPSAVFFLYFFFLRGDGRDVCGLFIRPINSVKREATSILVGTKQMVFLE